MREEWRHDEGVDWSRRSALAVIGGFAAGVAGYAVYQGVNTAMIVDRSMKVACAARAALIAKKESNEAVPNSILIPEDERTGSDIMVGSPIFFTPSTGNFGYIPHFDFDVGPLLEAIPDKTNVYVPVPKSGLDLASNGLGQEYPHLNFKLYPLPDKQWPAGILYIQDGVFATGTRDEQGRFVLLTSSADATRSQFADAKADPYEAAMLRQKSFIDEHLIDAYPRRFSAFDLPLSCIGGDMEITRLPNGGMGLIIGNRNLRFSIVHLRNQCMKNMHANGEFEGDVAPGIMPHDEFVNFVREVKELYKKFFNVDEVIVLDEDFLVQNARTWGVDNAFAMQGPGFFHKDMLVRTCTAPNGGPTAFCTAVHPMYEQFYTGPDLEYAARVRDQFQRLGYNIVPLNGTDSPSYGYTNVVMINPGGNKTVIVPKFGHHTVDGEAVDAYKNAGFQVIEGDAVLTQRKHGPKSGQPGGWHCMSEVLC